jgi:uncharacterized membrane protein YqiK
MVMVLFFIVGAGLTIGPWFMPQLSDTSRIVVTGFGVAVLLVVLIASVIVRFYRKASANMAFVRTGSGGAKVFKDGGAIVIPLVHHVIPVSLETMRLNVERRAEHALITKDNLRVDLSAEFYIKVQANTDDILQAARSLGGRNVQPDAVSELVEDKLVSALRTVAATKELVELHSKRDEFASAVQAIVMHDLASNGLTLESVTISSLDQTDPAQLQEKNVFDAQGLRKIAEITQKARVERNDIERAAEQLVVSKNVETRKKVLEMERDQAQFEAEQKSKIATTQAQRQREVSEFAITQDEAIARRNIEKSKQVETADIQKKQAVELASRDMAVAVAKKEQERAMAQSGVLKAEADREVAQQQVLTVTVTAEADREANKKLIAAKQIIMEKRIREETEADVQAYTTVKKAEGDKQAAEMAFAAKLRLAEGDAQSSTKRAEGDTALRMVDVNVEREKVGVEQARVEVERKSLSNRQEFEGAALKFELDKLRIEAEKEIRVAAAEAMGNMLAKAQMQIFGDPSTMAMMAQRFMQAASIGTAYDGLMKTLPPEGQELLNKVAASVASSLTPKHEAAAGNGAGAAKPSIPVEVAVRMPDAPGTGKPQKNG